MRSLAILRIQDLTSRGPPRARYERFERFTCAVQTIKGTGLGQWWHRTFHMCLYVPGHGPRGVYPLSATPRNSTAAAGGAPRSARFWNAAAAEGDDAPSTPHAVLLLLLRDRVDPSPTPRAVILNRSRGPRSDPGLLLLLRRGVDPPLIMVVCCCCCGGGWTPPAL